MVDWSSTGEETLIIIRFPFLCCIDWLFIEWQSANYSLRIQVLFMSLSAMYTLAPVWICLSKKICKPFSLDLGKNLKQILMKGIFELTVSLEMDYYKNLLESFRNRNNESKCIKYMENQYWLFCIGVSFYYHRLCKFLMNCRV